MNAEPLRAPRRLSPALLAGTCLLLLGIGLIAFVTYYNSSKREQPIVFSNNAMLSELWAAYKRSYLEPETFRTLDKQRANVTTSEGQSYTMLRAVWQDDKPTFDASWKWTRENLDRPNDRLSSWLFGQRPDGNYGVMTEQGGQNSASDADTDIALALLFAANRWNQPSYREDAQAIIKDIWDKDVATIGGRPYMTANDLEKNANGPAVVNPSYLAPYAYRAFAAVDPDHDWNAVIDTSYEVIIHSQQQPLDTEKSVGLPPDWLLLDRETAALSATGRPTLATTYGYDAMRLPFRLALDWQWHQDPRAKQALEAMGFLSTAWKQDGLLHAVYAHDGSVVGSEEAPAAYGGSLGYFLTVDPTEANRIYDGKLKMLYDPNAQDWGKPLGYYDSNWAWFGLALYHNALPNLSAS